MEVPMNTEFLPMTLNPARIKQTMEHAQKTKQWVLVFVIGTKPCFYKFYGSVIEAEKANIPYLIINSNQHYDKDLTYGAKEFNYTDKIGIDF